jgi:hypothetical protein
MIVSAQTAPAATEKLTWTQEADALTVKWPARFPTTHAVVFKIAFAAAKQ